jgi:hypothetical protein
MSNSDRPLSPSVMALDTDVEQVQVLGADGDDEAAAKQDAGEEVVDVGHDWRCDGLRVAAQHRWPLA